MDGKVNAANPRSSTKSAFIIELLHVLLIVFASIATAFFNNLFFFWPRRYKDISSDVILITGGGKGIGRLIAFEFAKRKPKQIILWGRTEDLLLATSKAIQLHGTPCDYMVCDVSDRQLIYAMANKVLKTYGSVDILVNNAGIVHGNTIMESSPEDTLQTVNVNMMSQIWTVRAFLPSMLLRNHGHIVSIDSMLGLMGLAGAADYCSSKFGALGFHESLRHELMGAGKNGIFVTTIHPFVVNTEMFSGVTTRFPMLLPPLDKNYVAWKVVNAICTNQILCLMPRIMYLAYFVKSILPADCMDHLHRFMWLDRAMAGFKHRNEHHADVNVASTLSKRS